MGIKLRPLLLLSDAGQTIDIINVDASLGAAVGWSRTYGSGGGSAQGVRKLDCDWPLLANHSFC